MKKNTTKEIKEKKTFRSLYSISPWLTTLTHRKYPTTGTKEIISWELPVKKTPRKRVSTTSPVSIVFHICSLASIPIFR